MKELVEYIATALVDDPAMVSVKQGRDYGNKVNLELRLHTKNGSHHWQSGRSGCQCYARVATCGSCP